MLNGIEWALAHGMNVAVVQLPDGDDPDSFVRREGGPALERLIDQAVPIGTWRKIHAPAVDTPHWFGDYEQQ